MACPNAHFGRLKCDDLSRIRRFSKTSRTQLPSLLLQAIGEFKYREIAEILELPIGTVMSHLSRARKHLRERLADRSRRHDVVRRRTPGSHLRASVDASRRPLDGVRNELHHGTRTLGTVSRFRGGCASSIGRSMSIWRWLHVPGMVKAPSSRLRRHSLLGCAGIRGLTICGHVLKVSFAKQRPRLHAIGRRCCDTSQSPPVS